MTHGHAAALAAEHAHDDPVSHRIIRTIARRTDCRVDQLPQLYDVVDPEALDTLFADRGLLDGHITFEYADHRVTVGVDGEIDIERIN